MRGDPTSPRGWATTLSKAWGPRFPVDVPQIALEYSKRFSDPVRAVEAAPISNFEGALAPLPSGGWAILYNPSLKSPGRVNFTLAHEWGHYLCHRIGATDGFTCGPLDVMGGGREMEREADQFASYLLMPLDDFRTQTAGQAMTLDLLTHCKDRYGVSFTAAALKWLEATPLAASLVVAENGHVLWGRRSDAAKRLGSYYPKGMELPVMSVAARGPATAQATGVELPAGVWGRHPAREIAIFADEYEMTISLLIFEAQALPHGWAEENFEDSYSRLGAAR